MDKLCKIRDIQRAVVDFEHKFENRYGVSLNHGMALCYLSRYEMLTSGQVGDFLDISSSNTSKVLSCLESKGYIKRVVGEKDKRQMYFSLTKNGKNLLSTFSCDTIESMPLLDRLLKM